MPKLAVFIFLLLLPTAPVDQQQSLEEWERQTFEKQPPDLVMDVAGIESGMVIGEVGAGRGRFTVHLARRVGPDGKVFANDIDAESLELLRERCQVAGIGNVEFVLGEPAAAHFPDASLDMIFMVWTYHWFEEPVAMLRSMKPALRPGGWIVLVEPDPVRGPGGPEHGVSEARVRAEAEAAGFLLLRTETLLPEDLIFVLGMPDESSTLPPRDHVFVGAAAA